jgi:hypothetical protein
MERAGMPVQYSSSAWGRSKVAKRLVKVLKIVLATIAGLVALLAVAWIWTATSVSDWEGPPDEAARPSNPGAERAEAGFYQIEPVGYALASGAGRERKLHSGPVRLFYSFHPAASRPAAGEKPVPLFVFWNGGPGCATATNLFAMNTAPFTLDMERVPAGATIAPNPYSWSGLGNLLYIDAPNTGFSHALAQNPSNPLERAYRFGLANYNPYIDAAQVARLLLRFLKEHPGLRESPLVLVGESYGGVRAQIVLDLLLRHGEYLEGKRFYRDPALAKEMAVYFSSLGTAPEVGMKTLSPGQMARFVPAQVLIEPQLTGAWQVEATALAFWAKGSVIDRLAQETGSGEWRPSLLWPWKDKADFVTDTVVAKKFGRDPYATGKPAEWDDLLEARTLGSLLDKATLSTALGVDAGSIAWLQPENRKHAFRFMPFLDSDVNDAAPPENRGLLGPLPAWDAYVVGTNPGAYASFFFSPSILLGFRDTDPNVSQAQGEMLLRNMMYTRTFITDAGRDLIILPEAIPESLRRYGDIVASVETRKEDPSRPGSGSIRVSYRPGALGGRDAPASAEIAFPAYPDAGHAVAAFDPAKLREDVRRWLVGAGVLSR